MLQQLQINRFTAATLFRTYFVGIALTFYPIAIIAGTAAAFGADTVKSGEVQLHGWRAVLDAVVAPPILAFFLAFFFLVCTWPGLWLASKFQRRTAISFYGDNPPPRAVRVITSEVHQAQIPSDQGGPHEHPEERANG